MLSRNKNKKPTANARASFTAGLAVRGAIEREIHRFLGSMLDIEYELKTVHKGWLESTYQLNIEYYGDNQKWFESVIKTLQDWFKQND